MSAGSLPSPLLWLAVVGSCGWLWLLAVAVGCGCWLWLLAVELLVQEREESLQKKLVCCVVCVVRTTHVHTAGVCIPQWGGWGGRRTTDDGGGVHRRHDEHTTTHTRHTHDDGRHTHDDESRKGAIKGRRGRHVPAPRSSDAKVLSRGGWVGTCRRPDHVMQRCYQGDVFFGLGELRRPSTARIPSVCVITPYIYDLYFAYNESFICSTNTT